LPFFDDFSNSGNYPSLDLWVDQQVFVNNTMSSGIKSRGCATFDGFDQFGIPYDSINPYTQVYADSLTSQIIDLSMNTPADSVYLSFYYQSKGWGFSPKPQDSLMLYLLRGNGVWQKVWSASDTTYSDFSCAMIPIKDTTFFKSNFQFRFVNKATVGISNSNWNVDYVLLDKNRPAHDSLFKDVAFTNNPNNLLNDFSAMPFGHFKTNPNAFLKPSIEAYLRNNGDLNLNLNYGLNTKEIITGTSIGNATGSNSFISNQENSILFTTPSIASFQDNGSNQKYIFENKYFVASGYPNEPVANDTIIQNQIFDNYFAYDDGSAEQVYFLNLFPNAPGKIAIEYALYKPDTIRGISVLLPRQVPSGKNKEFSLAIYKNIGINGQQEELVYQESYLYPEYQEGINEFTTYAFEQPVAMPQGVFYAALIQSAGGGSDSLYIGLDKNRTEANHRYFNVDGNWVGSSIDGALMIRPLVGGQLPPTSIQHPENKAIIFSIYPNPAKDLIYIETDLKISYPLNYLIRDMEGRAILHGAIKQKNPIHVQSLSPGMYFLQISDKEGNSNTIKFIHQ